MKLTENKILEIIKGVLTEGRDEIKEIDLLATDIINYLTKVNIGFLKDFTEGLGLSAINLKVSEFQLDSPVTDISQYQLLKKFLREFRLEVKIDKNISAGGLWQRLNDNGGAVVLKIREKHFIDKLKWFISVYKLNEKWSNEKAFELLNYIFKDEFKSVLVHELQHAFDDFRSGGKYTSDKKSKKYQQNLDYNPYEKNSKMTDSEKASYYGLPHEYWARFSSYVTRNYMNFKQPFNTIFENFKLFFIGYDSIGEKDKRKLQKALYKYWSEENDIRENRIIENVLTEMDENLVDQHNYLVSLIKRYNLIPSSYRNKKRELFTIIQRKAQSLNYSLGYNGDVLVAFDGDKQIKTIAIRQSKDDINSHQILSDYPTDFQSFVNGLFNSGGLSVHNLDINADPVQAQKNISSGKKTVSANNALDSLESMFNKKMIYVKSTRNSPSLDIPLSEYMQYLNGNDDEDFELYQNEKFGNVDDDIYSRIASNESKIKQKNIMKIEEKDLKSLITRLVEEVSSDEAWKSMDEWVPGELDESTFEIDADDSNMQTKIAKIKNDSTLFNKDTDEIKITSECKTYSKSEFGNMVNEARKEKGKNDDYLKAIKKADRELDIELNGPGFKAGDKAHKDKTKYDRKAKYTKSDLIEMFSKVK